MQIWVDADACPVAVKEILFRAADRTGIMVTLVANKLLRVPPSAHIRALQVPGGFDVADKEIVQKLQPGDLVITTDIPLAAEVIANDAHALNPRGEMYDKGSIGERLAMRHLMEDLRNSGVELGGPSSFSQADRQAFAAALDRFIARNATTTSNQPDVKKT
ncbi:YaiI/YqxD family protein [Methylobacillus methanolivorans]